MSWRSHIARFGSDRFPGEPWVRWTFIALFVVAAVLRCWNYTAIPYTHDEISALVRIHPTLAETVRHGVIELDTHPPGVQVFEWFWTNAFGMDEAWVKLPFTVLALLALFLFFRFAIVWTSATSALLLTTVLATIQYTVLYAQIARPYAVGFFTIALLADQLTRYLALGGRRALWGVGVGALLSAYTHHFSLMVAALIVVTGALLVQPRQRKSYLLMGAIVLVLYLPNIPIFLHQLGQGGLGGWLAPPTRHWVPDHAWWIVHCSWLFAVPMIGLLVLAQFRKWSNSPGTGPGFWFLLTWGGVPLLAGLVYSIWRAPVIQYSVLLFSFPFLFLWFIEGMGELGRLRTLALCAVIGTVSVVTLITARHHYRLFYASKYEAIVQGALDAMARYGPARSLILVDAPEEVILFYLEHWGIDPAILPYTQLREQESDLLARTLERTDAAAVFYGYSNGAIPEHLARIQASFPYLTERRDLLEGQTFLFQADKTGPGIIDTHLIAEATPEHRTDADWDIHDDLPVVQDREGVPCWSFEDREFGCAVTIPVDPSPCLREDEYEVAVEFSGPIGDADVAVVLELRQADSTVFYRTGEATTVDRNADRQMLFVAARRASVAGDGPVTLKTYIHHRGKGDLMVRRFRVLKRDADPVQYGLVRPIGQLGPFVE